MVFQTGDYVVLCLAGVMTLVGLIRGFSGTLAFVLASLCAASVGAFAWTFLASAFSETWMRMLATLAIGLLAFGLVRMIVKKIVNGLLAQPADAVFGMLIGLAFSLALVGIWALSGIHLEQSQIATRVADFLSDDSVAAQLDDLRR